MTGRVSSGRVAAGGQEQQPPPQQPPPPADGGGCGAPPRAEPVTATVDSSLTVSSCPSGHGAGSDALIMGRETSKVDPQARQR